MKGGIGQLMKQAQQMQENMQKAQEELGRMEVTGESASVARLLQHYFPTTQEKRETETHHRSIFSECTYPHSNIPHGECTISKGIAESGTMDSFHRPPGRVLPHSRPEEFSEVPPVCDRQQSMAVQSPPIRAFGGTGDLHRCHELDRYSLSRERHPDSSLPRRLAHQSKFEGGGETTNTVRHTTHDRTGTDVKRRKKSAGTFTKVRFPGIPVRPRKRDSRADFRKCAKSGIQGPTHFAAQGRFCRSMAIVDRDGKFCGFLDPLWQATSVPTRDACTSPLVLDEGRPIVPKDIHSIVTRNRGRSSLVDATSTMESQSISSAISTCTSSVHRRKSVRLGQPHGLADCVGDMDNPGGHVTHKRFRMSSSVACASTVRSPSTELLSTVVDRQHDDYGLYKQGRGNKKYGDVHDYTRSPTLVPPSQHQVKSCAYQGLAECDGRPVIEGPKDRKYGMESPSGGGTDAVGHLVRATHRPVCHALQQEVTSIRQPLPRSSSSGSRCHDDGLGRTDSVRVSSIRPSEGSSQETGRDATVQHDPDRSILAKPELVSSTKKSVSSTATVTASSNRSTKAANSESVPPKSGRAEPSRLAVIQKNLTDSGLPKTVTDVMLQATRSSTQALYEKRWTSFSRWCAKENITPTEVSVPQILLYLDFLRTDLKLTPGTIMGHKTAIIVTLESCEGISLRSNLMIKQYIKGLTASAAPRRTLPDWDLSLVLRALMLPPFEPLKTCDTKYLTFKTLFLLAFATAARRSELHALSKDFLRDHKWSFVRLKTIEGFLAKNQTGNDFRSFTVKSLRDFVGSSGLEDEELMCPVRALRIYTNRTLRDPENLHLFVSFKKGHTGGIHPNTVSSWLKQCIKLCYELSGKPLPDKIVGHSVRAMSVSWASLKNVSVAQIMEACSWRSVNTFISYYLKDLTEIEGDMYRIGKVSVSSTVV